MSGNNVFAIAYKYHTLGRYIIPSGGGTDGKSALIQWKPYQTTRPTDTQLQEWQSQLRHKSALMTMRYLKTLSADEFLKIQQAVDFQW